MSASIFKQDKPVSYAQLHQQYLALQDKVFSNTATKFGQATRSPEIEQLYFSSNNFIQSLDKLHSHYNGNKEETAIHINKEMNSILKTALGKMQEVDEVVRDLNPKVKTSFSKFGLVKIFLDEYTNQCDKLRENLIDNVANHVATLQRKNSWSGFVSH